MSDESVTVTSATERAVPTWPTYEDTGEPVELGDRVVGTWFDHNGADYQHEGELYAVTTEVGKRGFEQWAMVETDDGRDWECDTDCLYLVSKGGEGR